jgi:hypothetical protein
VNIMKKLLRIVAFWVVSTKLLAQLNPLPPSSLVDGVVSRNIGMNAGATHWDDAQGLAVFKLAADDNKPLTSLDMRFGSTLPAAFLAERARINSNGGTIRAIFLGESAGWLNHFGYAYDGVPSSSNSYTAFRDMQANPGTPYPVNMSFGNYIDLNLGLGSASSFDFWLDAVGSDSQANPGSPTADGGVYTVFNPAASSPSIPPGNALYLQEPLMVSTWLPALGEYRDIATFIVGFEDSRMDRPIDADYSDLIMGFQFFVPEGFPYRLQAAAEFAPVPEPSSYACLGAIVLVALMLRRGIAVSRRRGNV